MLGFLKTMKPDYQNQLEWPHPNQPVLAAWDIKVIAHDWLTPLLVIGGFVNGGMLIFLLFIYYFIDNDIKSNLIGGGTVLFFLSLIMYLEICRKNRFVYRLIPTGIDYHHWRVYPDFLFSIPKLALITLGIIALIIGFFSEQGVFLIAGPVSVAIAAILPATGADYKRWAVNQRSGGIDWRYITKFEYDPKKRLIRLLQDLPTSEEEKQEVMRRTGSISVITVWSHDFFLTKDVEQKVLSYCQHYLPNVPMVTTTLKLPEIV